MSDPQNILPEEVWNLILNSVNDPRDILSCFQTCTLFKNYLSLTRTTWAFSLVLPSLFEYLPRNDVLQCRLVSKSWRIPLDSYMQSDQFAPRLVKLLRNYDKFSNNLLTRIPKYKISDIANLYLEMQNRPRQWPVGLNDAWIPDHQKQLEEFVSVFRNNFEKNPFPSKAVVLTISETDIECTLQLLDLLGAHIWSLGIVVRFTTMDRYQLVQLFWKILNRVPNLKHLLIDQSPDHINVSDIHQDHIAIANLITSTVPEVKQLKWIELKIGYMNLHDIIVDAFGNRPVTIFGLVGGIDTSNISENDWKHLHLDLNGDVANMIWDLQMKSLKHLHLPLETINLMFAKCVDLKSIFENLSKYALTLRELTLTLVNLKDEELIGMKQDVGTLYTSCLSNMKCLSTFNMILFSENPTNEFHQFLDQIWGPKLSKKYLKVGWSTRGFSSHGFSGILGIQNARSGH